MRVSYSGQMQKLEKHFPPSVSAHFQRRLASVLDRGRKIYPLCGQSGRSPLRRKSQRESSLHSSSSSFLVPVECGALPISAPCTPRISELQAPLHHLAYPSISSPRILGCWSYTQSPISHLVLRLLHLEYHQHPRVHIRGSPQ